MMYRSTKEVAELLGIPVGRLKNSVWDSRVPSPRKLGGVYAWSDRDVHRASWVLRRRDADDVLIPDAGGIQEEANDERA